MIKKVTLAGLVLLTGTITADENFLKKINECYQVLPKKVKTAMKLTKNGTLTSSLVGITCLGVHFTLDHANFLKKEFDKAYFSRDCGNLWGSAFCTTFVGLATLLGITLSGTYLYEYVIQLKAIAQDKE